MNRARCLSGSQSSTEGGSRYFVSRLIVRKLSIRLVRAPKRISSLFLQRRRAPVPAGTIRVRSKVMQSRCGFSGYCWRVQICHGRTGAAELGPIGIPVAVSSRYPQGEHVFGVVHAPPGAGALQALLRDVAMRALDLA